MLNSVEALPHCLQGGRFLRSGGFAKLSAVVKISHHGITHRVQHLWMNRHRRPTTTPMFCVRVIYS